MGYITITLRCSNKTTYSDTPFRDITYTCIAVKPKYVDEEGSEISKDVGGFQGNGIARRRRYELVIVDASVAEDASAHDYGTIERNTQFLFARKLWIKEVTDSPRVFRTDDAPETAIDFWADGNGVDLPVEVRRVSFDYGDGENGFLSPVLVLEEVEPRIGVEIG
jgi:hypothetical protein